MPIVVVGTVILYPVIPFINVTEIRTLRSSSLDARILGARLLWVFSVRGAGKVNSSKNRLAKEVSAKRGLDTLYLRMADADEKMRTEKIVNNNKNKKNTNLDIYIVSLKHFLTKQVYNKKQT